MSSADPAERTITALIAWPRNSSSIEVTLPMASLSTGVAKLDAHLASPDFFDSEKFPTATFKSSGVTVTGKDKLAVAGDLTFHGVTKPVKLEIDSFKCMQHPMLKREVSGADAEMKFNRDEFGLDYGKQYGFKMETKLRIQVEGLKQDASVAQQ